MSNNFKLRMAFQEQSVAKEFAKVLREWLTVKEMAEVVELNNGEYKNDPLTCATHDFCDANMAMAEAFDNLGLKTCIDYEDVDCAEAVAALDLWNATWDIAKAADFNVEAL